MAALIPGLTFVTLQPIALIAGLTFVTELPRRLGRSDALFEFFNFQTDFFFHSNSPPFCFRLTEKISYFSPVARGRTHFVLLSSFPVESVPGGIESTNKAYSGC